MPGGEDSYDLIRTKDERSNSKADTFSINPKRLGTTDHQVQQIALQTLSGDLTNGNAIDSLTGDGLRFNNGTLESSVKEGTIREVFGQDSSIFRDVELLEFGDKFTVSTTIIDIAIIELDTPFTDLSLLFGSPVAVGDTLEVGDITDGNRTVYDASTDTVGDGTTTADHASTDSDAYQTDGTTHAEKNNNGDIEHKPDVVDTDEGQANNETFIRGERNSDSQSVSSGTFVTACPSSSKDNRGEFSGGEVTPDKSGEYIVRVKIGMGGPTADGDPIVTRIKDVDSGDKVDSTKSSAPQAQFSVIEETFIAPLDAGTTYKIQTKNDSSDFVVTTTSQFEVVWSFVQ